MPAAPIHSLKDILLLNGRGTLIILPEITEEQVTLKTSSFSLPAWDPERLPSAAHLFEDLPSRIQEHLRVIIDQHYPTEAARTTFTNHMGYSVTPDDVLAGLRARCTISTFDLSHEIATRAITVYLSYEVKVIYEALTGNRLNVRPQERTSDSSVITDYGFRFGDGIKILWADKSSRAFDRFIGELMEQMRDRSAVELCTEPVPTTYRGYKAILGKVRVSPSSCRTSPT